MDAIAVDICNMKSVSVRDNIRTLGVVVASVAPVTAERAHQCVISVAQ